MTYTVRGSKNYSIGLIISKMTDLHTLLYIELGELSFTLVFLILNPVLSQDVKERMTCLPTTQRNGAIWKRIFHRSFSVFFTRNPRTIASFQRTLVFRQYKGTGVSGNESFTGMICGEKSLFPIETSAGLAYIRRFQ